MSGADSAAGSTTEIALTGISGTRIHEPTSVDLGWVDLLGVGGRVEFSPNQQASARDFVSAVEAAMRGETPAAAGVEGLNFVALEVNTANVSFGSVCRVAAVRFTDGEPAGERVWLCRPPVSDSTFDGLHVARHGVTPEDVAGSPSFAETLPEILDFTGGLPLLAHNAQFAVTALRDAAAAAEVQGVEGPFGCSLALVRHSPLEVADRRLPSVSSALGLEVPSLLDALSVARAAGEITVTLARQLRHRGSLMELLHSRGLTLGEISGLTITPVLVDRSGAGRSLQASGVTSPAPQAALRGEEAQASGAGTDFREPTAPKAAAPAEESGANKRGPAPWQAVATPDQIPEPSAGASPDDPLNGQNITLTGDFEPYDKGMLWSAIAEHGGQVAKNVTKKSTILVTGAWATKTSKEKRAEELIEKGQNIRIWSADQLYAALGLDEQPPF